MARRSLKNRYNRRIVGIGDSLGLTFPIEHIDELDWKKGKEVKTHIHNGFWIVFDRAREVDELIGGVSTSTEVVVDNSKVEALELQLAEMAKKLKDSETKSKKASSKIKELETKLSQQQGNLF